MNYLAACGLFSFLSGFLCALFVFFQKPRTPIKILWSLYGLGMAIWGFGIFQLFSTTHHDSALFWSRLTNWVAVPIPVFFFHFVLLLTNRFKEKFVETIFYYVVSAVYLVISIIYSSDFIPEVSPKINLLFYPSAGKLFYIFAAMFLYLCVYGLYVLYCAYLKASAVRRNQYKYFFIASLFGLCAAAMMLLPVFNLPIFPYAAIGVPIYNLLVAYIILKHSLLDIRVVVRKSLVYMMFVSVLTVLYILAVYTVDNTFRNVLGYHAFIGSTASVAIIAAIFIPLKDYVQSLLDRRFFKIGYLQMIEQNDLLRQQVLTGERYKTMSTIARRIITELRNPLTVLSDYGKQLPDHFHDQAFLERFSQEYNIAVDRTQVLISYLAGYGDSKPLVLAPVNLNVVIDDVLHDVLMIVEEQVQNKSIVVYRNFSFERDMRIDADIQQITQVLYAFLNSAVKSMNGAGQLWVGIEQTDEYIEISIKDTGRGLSQDDLDKIFDPLSALNIEDVFASLSSAHNIVHNHGGKVIVDTEVGVGTEWVIQLPRLS